MNKSITTLLAFVIFFTPFAFGTVDVWSEFVLKISILTIFFLFILKSIRKGVLEYRINTLNIFFPAFILYMAFQIVFKKSILPYNTFNALEITIIYFMLYLVVAGISKDRENIHNIISKITIAGFLVSLLGIIQFVTKTDKIFWVKSIRYHAFFGPFVNENHFACYISMVSLITLGSIISSIYKWEKISPGLPFKYMVLKVFGNIFNKKTLFKIFAFGLMVASIFLSRSRSGMIFFLASAAFFILFVGAGRRAKKIIWIVLPCILISYLLLNRMGTDVAASRLGSIFKSNEYEGRITMYLYGLKVVKDYPLFGTGIGTFANIFPMYQFGKELQFYEHLHSDILQFLIEAGIAGFIIISIPLLTFLIKFILRVTGTSDTYRYYVGLSIFSSLFYLSLHSMTDFGMRLNAISSLFIILIAIATPLMDPGKERKLYIKDSRLRPILYTTLIILFIYSSFLSSKPFIVSLLCGKGATSSSFQLAMRIDPKDDKIYFNYCNFIIGKIHKKEIEENTGYKIAAETIDKAIQLNPYKTNYLTARAQIYFWQYDYDKAFDLLKKTTLTEPDNPRVNLIYSYMIFWKAINEIDTSERKKLLALGIAYYKRAGILSEHVHLYNIIDNERSYYLLKSALKDYGINID